MSEIKFGQIFVNNRNKSHAHGHVMTFLLYFTLNHCIRMP